MYGRGPEPCPRFPPDVCRTERAAPRGTAKGRSGAPSFVPHTSTACPVRPVLVRLAYLLCSFPSGLGASSSAVAAAFQLMSPGSDVLGVEGAAQEGRGELLDQRDGRGTLVRR